MKVKKKPLLTHKVEDKEIRTLTMAIGSKSWCEDYIVHTALRSFITIVPLSKSEYKKANKT